MPFCCCLNTQSAAPPAGLYLDFYCQIWFLPGSLLMSHSHSPAFSTYITIAEASQTVLSTLSPLSHYVIIMCILFLVFTSNNTVCNHFIYLLVHMFIVCFHSVACKLNETRDLVLVFGHSISSRKKLLNH